MGDEDVEVDEWSEKDKIRNEHMRGGYRSGAYSEEQSVRSVKEMCAEGKRGRPKIRGGRV